MADCSNILGVHGAGFIEPDGAHDIDVQAPVGEQNLCVLAPECYAVVWYVFGDTVVGLDNNYYGLKDMSCCKEK